MNLTDEQRKALSAESDKTFKLYCVIIIVSFILTIPFIIFAQQNYSARSDAEELLQIKNPSKYRQIMRDRANGYESEIVNSDFMTPLILLSMICGIPFFICCFSIYTMGYGIIAFFKVLPSVIALLLKIIIIYIVYNIILLFLANLFTKKKIAKKDI